MNDLISIGLPFYNDAAYLGAAIKSVLNQTYKNWELLLVSDSSNDESIKIARSFSDSRIKIFEFSFNAGLSRRLNEIANLANGKYLFRMDADDLMHPARLEKQWEILHNSQPNTVVGTAAIELNERGYITRLIRSCGSRRGGYSARRAFIHPTVAAHTVWFRSNPYSEIPIFRRVQDAELWIRTSASSQFVLLDEPLLFYRRPSGRSFDKYLWQAMALIYLLAFSPVAGCVLKRSLLFVSELLKLQVRFHCHLLDFDFFRGKNKNFDNPNLLEYRKLLDEMKTK
jgi:glycosyltransferase involved in cell wall biosynthesis